MILQTHIDERISVPGKMLKFRKGWRLYPTVPKGKFKLVQPERTTKALIIPFQAFWLQISSQIRKTEGKCSIHRGKVKKSEKGQFSKDIVREAQKLETVLLVIQKQ